MTSHLRRDNIYYVYCALFLILFLSTCDGSTDCSSIYCSYNSLNQTTEGRFHLVEAPVVDKLAQILRNWSECQNRTVQAPDIVIAGVGALPDFLGMVHRAKTRDPLIQARLLAGIEQLHRIIPLGYDSLPPGETARLIRATALIARILTAWAANRYGERPDELEVYSLRQLLQWMAGDRVGGAFYGACVSRTPSSLDWARQPFNTDSALPLIVPYALENGEHGRSPHLSSRTGAAPIGAKDGAGTDRPRSNPPGRRLS